MKAFFAGMLTCLTLLVSPQATAVPITINNGVTGDGAWQVTVDSGGDSSSGVLDPAGPIGPSDVIFDLATLVDPGADGRASELRDTTITSPPTLTAPGQVSSSGTFVGVNGPVNWNSVSRIAPNSLIYQNSVTFSSGAPFGTLRVLCYLDEDVVGSGDDIMVLFGTPGQADFNVLTVDNTDNFGVAHAAGYLTATNATYIGWAADEYSDLINAIANAGTTYSIPGVIDTTSLPPITDARYPGRPVFGPNDITNAFAFDVTPTATTATIACSLGGLPTGQLPALTIAKSAAATVANGSDLVYTLRYANTGPAATGVVIRDRLPMGATFVSASDGGTLAGDIVTWAIGNLLANSGDRTLTLTVRVSGIAGSAIVNSDYSISGTGLSMVAGAPVSTTLTAATVIIPPTVPNTNACAVLPLPANVAANAAALSTDANFVFFFVPNATRNNPRCRPPQSPCPLQEISVYNRAQQTTRVLTANSTQSWNEVYALSGNRAWLISGGDSRTSGAVTVPAPVRGQIVLADAATGSLMPLSTPTRTAANALGMPWSGEFLAASYNGNRIILDEAVYDVDGALLGAALTFVDIAMQTTIDLRGRIATLAGLAPTALARDQIRSFALSGDGNRVSFSSSTVLTGTARGVSVLALPNNLYRLRELAYLFDVPSNRLILVADPDLSRARLGGASSVLFVRELGATGTLVALDRTVPFLNTAGNPEQNGEIYIAQPGIGITQVTSTTVPLTGNYLSPGLAFMTPNERYVYFHAEQNLVGRNADMSNELFRYDLQTGQLRQVTTRFDARAELMAFLGLTSIDSLGNELVGNDTSFDGRFVLMTPTGPATTVDLGGGARGVVFERPTLFDCQ